MRTVTERPVVVVGFAGGGGSSQGIKRAIGRDPDIGINHDEWAIAMHRVNHPDCEHYCQNIWKAVPSDVVGRRRVGLAWFSPDCRHFSKAKGGKPVVKRIRDLAWVVVAWAKSVRPSVMIVENVEEFRSWGPLDLDGRPSKEKAGQTFKQWCAELRRLGYRVEWQELRACDYGSPTIRRRLFLVARCDGLPIVWPAPTHAAARNPEVVSGILRPNRTAADIIDWWRPCPSIFLTREQGRAIGVKRPLVDATLRRIAAGVRRYVIEAADPFIVSLTHQGGDRVYPVDEPLHTVTSANRGEKALVVPTLIQTGYGERDGQAPRVPGLDKPLGTVVAGGCKHSLVAAHLTKFRAGAIGSGMDEPVPTITANSYIQRPGGAPPIGLVAAFLAQHNTGVVGHPVTEPLSTITQTGSHQAVVSAGLLNMKGAERRLRSVEEPVPTVTAGGWHVGEVRAFLTTYYGTDQDPRLSDPMHTVTTKDRFGLVSVEIQGQPYAIVDIGMRMLHPRELFRANGVDDDFVIDIELDGKPITRTTQIRMAGNMVCPDPAAALVRANYVEMPAAERVVA